MPGGSNYHGRESQIDLLRNLYAEEPFPDTIFVHGASGTGKSSVVESVLSSCESTRVVAVNLIECYTTKILYESILRKLCEREGGSGSGGADKTTAPSPSCDNMMDFIETLRRLDKSSRVNFATTVIIFDKAELLRSMDDNLLGGFFRFRELSRLELSIVFISRLPFQKFYVKTNLVEPIEIYFPQYTKRELFDILMITQEDILKQIQTQSPNGHLVTEETLKNFVSVLLSTLYRTCRDVTELKSMATINFPIYCKPVLDTTIKPDNASSLWKNIAPTLKKSSENLYMRISRRNADLVELENLGGGLESIELPVYANYLLIAAYLASYNPAKDDEKVFVKCSKKKKKTKGDVKAKGRNNEQLNTQTGPKSFNLNRLIAIFYSILDNKVGFNNNLLTLISTLVKLQLLTAASDGCNLDGQKYKCAVGFDFIQNVAKLINFNIRKYLSDFNHM